MPASLRAVTGTLLLVTFLTLGACGGGGGNGGTTPPTQPTPPVQPAPPPLIGGDATRSLSVAVTDAHPSRVSPADTSSGYLLSRVVADVDPSATVAQFDAAAASIGATGIASSAQGSTLISLTVPRQDSVSALRALAAKLQTQPGVAAAWAAREGKVSVLPVKSPGHPVDPSLLSNLLASRFPQAWNARQAAPDNCQTRTVPVYVLDAFGDPTTRPTFISQIDPSQFVADPKGTSTLRLGHGYDVASVLAGAFDSTPATGANPFRDCVEIDQIEALGLDISEALRQVVDAMAGDTRRPLILNLSINFDDTFCGPTGDQPCDTTTIPITSADTMRGEIIRRVRIAAHWAQQVNATNLPTTLFIAQAVGNVDPLPKGILARDYLGFSDASFSSAPALATHLGQLADLLSNPAIWKSPSDTRLPDATFDTNTAAQVAAGALQIAGGSATSRANLLLVDSGTNGSTKLEDVQISDFDFSGADIRAVGQDVPLSDVTDPLEKSGTSFAAPQIAGLASFLWVISPDLRREDVKETVNLLKSASRTTPNSAVPVIDALNAVLALDTPGNRPLARLGILDVNGDGVFDHLDLVQFAQAYGLGIPNTPDIPAAADYSRFDLNGDGLTGGIPIHDFDLDDSGTNNIASLTIEGYPIDMNEAALSDIQVLCYYAYAKDSSGNNLLYDSRDEAIQQRTAILGPDHCVEARLTASLPPQVTGATPVNVNVQRPSGQGNYAPAANVQVSFTPTCATASPATATTDSSGNATSSITPNAGCHQVSVDVTARAAANSPVLAHQVVSATVSGTVINLLSIDGTPTGYRAEIDGATVFPQPGEDLNAALARALDGVAGIAQVQIFSPGVPTPSPDVTINLPLPVGSYRIQGNLSQPAAGPCGPGTAPNITLNTGDVVTSLANGVTGFGSISIFGCLNVTLNAGNIEETLEWEAFSGTSQARVKNVANVEVADCTADCPTHPPSPRVDLTVDTVAGIILQTVTNATFNFTGSIASRSVDHPSFIRIIGNTNLTLGHPMTAGDVVELRIDDNTFAVTPGRITTGNAAPVPNLALPGSVSLQRNTGFPLSAWAFGSVAGSLSIVSNHGFTNEDATSFAQAHTVTGATIVGGNAP